jgi:hypothetical protein
MTTPYEPEEFDHGAGKLAAAIIFGVFALQIGFAGMHLYLSERYPASAIVAPTAREEPRRPATPSAVEVCAAAEADIALCDTVVARVLAETGTATDTCRPPGDTRSAGSVVRRYLVEHPDAAGEAFEAVLRRALEQAWPCQPN